MSLSFSIASSRSLRLGVGARQLAVFVALSLVASMLFVGSVPAAAVSGQIDGTVFDDINENGTNDAEAGVAGVIVEAIDAAGNVGATATTNGSGDYALTGLTDGITYRVEFSGLPAGYESGPAGADSETSVRFAQPDTSGVDYGIHVPSTCAHSIPTSALLNTYNTAVSCTVRSDTSYPQDTFGLIDVSNAVPASGRIEQTGSTPMFHLANDWSISRLGNVFGVAVDSERGDIFTVASSNWSSGMYNDVGGPIGAATQYGTIGGGADDLGAAGTIYRLDAVTGTPAVFAQLPQSLTTITHRDCENGDSRSRDTGVGLGHITYDATNDQLFVTNFEDGRIYRLAMDGSVLDAYDPYVADDGVNGIPGDTIPFAVEIADDGSRLWWGTLYGRQVVSIDLTGAGGFPGSSGNVGGLTVFSGSTETVNITLTQSDTTSNPGVAARIQQFVSDLQIAPDGTMLVGLRAGCYDTPHSSYNHFGETQQLTANGAGIYSTTLGAMDISVQEYAGIEDSYGGVSHYVNGAGDTEFVVSSADILNEAGPHGLAVFGQADASGTPISPLGAIDYGTADDPKGIGGDVDVLNTTCVNSPIEIGNYVWFDADADGVQDPDEAHLAGVGVTLYAANGTTVIATTTTDASGQYLFDSVDGVRYNTDYEIGFDVSTNTTPLPGGAVNSDLIETAVDTGTGTTLGADANDSDVAGGRITTTTGGPGQNDHTLDAGFTLPYDLALTKAYTSDDFGNTTDGIVEDGSDVTFTITVTNQGFFTASTFTVTDYLPTGFDLNDGTWSTGVGNTATFDYTGALIPGDTVDIPITVTANGASAGDAVNWAEISADDGNDQDSTPNATQGDDNQPAAPGDPTDDEIDNASGDEDDHDPAGVTVQAYDLALIKTYASDDFGNTTDGIIADGSDVTFTITVANQGTQTASAFTITDYLPIGFDLNDGAWTAGAGNTATYDYVGTLAPATATDIAITLTANGAADGDYVNWAEISADDGNDIDSTTDATQGNDNQPADVGDPTDNVTDNTDGDEDDHDPAGVTVSSYDLALTKAYTSDDFGNTTDGIIENGSDVTFTITVTNQGTLPANAFTITDYIPTGFDLNDGAWTAGPGNTATYDYVGTLARSASTDITITLTANGTSAGEAVNWAEISADDGNDTDSTTDTDRANDNQPADVGDPTDDVIDNTDGDEDDHDPAGVTVQAYDLALIKTYTSDDFGNTTDGIIENGSDVTFTITVTNQGTVAANAFTVTDYLPANFDLDDPAWTAGPGNTATYDYVGTLAPATATDITITLTANGAADGDHVNWAEISADDGNDPDSTPDGTQGNDNQPANVGDPTDGVIDNTDGDEDDHDPAGVTITSYDLALIKRYTSDDFGNTTDGTIADGSDVTFTITVANQGTQTASNFTVTDYIPAGFDLNDGAWTTGAGNTATYDYVGTLAPATATDITITLTANGAADGDHVNWAEISADDGSDIDSTTDETQGNDNQPANVGDPTDNVTDNTNGDEDDHDPAGVTITSYDLALIKTYTSDTFGDTTDGVLQPGANATFTITVANQGTQAASAFTVTDYIPSGFVLNDGAWTAGPGNTAAYDYVGTLAPATATDITITLQATAVIGAGDYVNWAEISADDGADRDSTPDAAQGNDNQPVDVGDPTDDVTDNTDGDEDDHDPAGITVEIYDLALIKTYTSDDFGNATDGVIDDGSDVTFTITVTNQGSVAANTFTVTDYLPAGFDLNDGAWTTGAGNTATYDYIGTLAPGTSTDITITLTANGAAPGDHVNWAEISADDGADRDSTTDTTQGNDNQPAAVGDPTDDLIDNTDGDEDDHDPAGVSIVNYDLALIKTYTSDTYGATTDGLIADGSDATFTITVTNQGTLPASTFTITDYIPAGFDLNDGAWTTGAGNTATYDYIGTLAPATSTDITITLTANGTSDGDYVNWAEISADDGDDEDSVPDVTQSNDNQPANVGDPTDDVIDNTSGDEDDHDPAGIGVVSYDLALIKTYTSDDVGNPTDGVVENGGNATFTITVTNQGTLAASAFTITDYIPAGFDLNDGAWTTGAGNTATYDYVGTLAPATSTDITITLTANGASAGDAVNWAEISADDGDDTDSIPDTTQGNDNQPVDVGDPTDDVTDNTSGDEDDHDPAGITVEVYDLALIKTYTSDGSVDGLASDGRMQLGDDVTFTITVTNQGSVDATAFTITDYLPTGFVLADAAWTPGAGDTATRTIGPLAAGASIDTTITMRAVSSAAGDHVNWAEISSDDGNDIDSIPDTTQGNDNQPTDVGDPTDDVTDNTSGDEDDHDPAGITVDSYDLALTKTYTSDDFGDTTDGVIENGSTATFTITVTNQGTADATTFTVTDYLPAGFVLDDAAWTAGPGDTAAIDAGPLAAGDSVDLTITLRATTASVGSTINWAEISADDGNDADSTPDATQGNDNQPAAVGDPTDDVIDNTSGDEDDHDPAGLTVTGTFDLALLKIVDASATTTPVVAGQTATFEITVINQGSLAGSGLSVIDYVDLSIWEAFDPTLNPSGVTTGDQTLPFAWAANGTDGVVTITGAVPAGELVQIPVTLRLAAAADLDDILNTAEISAASPENPDGTPVAGVTDVDSTPDTVDDDPVVDDVTDNSGGDEDDHDIATLEPPTYSLGNQVWFDENDNGVIDAGETPIGQVQVQLFTDTNADGLPDDRSGDDVITGDDAIATTTTDSAGLYLFPGLDAGDYVVGIAPNQWDESAPLRGLLPSTPTEPNPNTDIDGDNNGATGDHGYVLSGPVTIGDGEPIGESPDNDSATAEPNENLTVDFGFWMPNFDLALRKQLADGSNSASVENGDQVTFRLTVFNQGTVTADQIELIDYVPAGLTLDDPDWATTSNGATIALTGVVLEPGESTSVDITVRVTATETGRIVNLAEITAANPVGVLSETLSMPNGEPIPDLDSTPDANDSEDPVDDEIGNGGGDEDDHDVAQVNVLGQATTTTVTTVTPLALTGPDVWRTLAAGLLLAMAGAVLLLGERRRQYGTI